MLSRARRRTICAARDALHAHTQSRAYARAHHGHNVVKKGGKRCKPRESKAPSSRSEVDELRRAGASWMDVVKHDEARKELVGAFMLGARLGTKFKSDPVRATKKALATMRKWRAAASAAVPVTALRHAGGTWLDVLTHPEFKSQLWNARPFQPVWLRQGAMEAAEASRGARSVVDRINPFVHLRHAGASRWTALTHESTRSYYWARVVCMYVATVVERPFITALLSSVSKCVVSDVFVQTALEGRSIFDLDWNRVASFFILGVTYVGAFQYRLYNHVLKPLNDKWRPIYGVSKSTGFIVFVDQAFIQPFLYMPTFLAIRIMSEGSKLVDLPRAVLERWRETGPETMLALWAVWVPAQVINFGVVPKHLTIPWMNAVGFAWNGVLSFMHGRMHTRADAERIASDLRAAAKTAAVGDAELDLVAAATAVATATTEVEAEAEARIGEEET